MKQYINKAAVEAEIDKLDNQDFCVIDDLDGRTAYLRAISDFYEALYTLEVKEVDLEGEVESYWKQCDLTWCRDAYTTSHIRIMLSDIARHFYELGLKAQKDK